MPVSTIVLAGIVIVASRNSTAHPITAAYMGRSLVVGRRLPSRLFAEKNWAFSSSRSRLTIRGFVDRFLTRRIRACLR